MEDIVPIMMLANKKKLKVGDQEAERKVTEKVRMKAELMIKRVGRIG